MTSSMRIPDSKSENTLDNPIWKRLDVLEFDDSDAEIPFTDRLARQHRWGRGFAERVVEEYRRFAFLATISDEEVTPSEEVDEAWHLHLTYTKHYWGPFTEILGRPLHHTPTRGGAAELDRFWDNYQRTL